MRIAHGVLRKDAAESKAERLRPLVRTSVRIWPFAGFVYPILFGLVRLFCFGSGGCDLDGR